MDKLGSHLKCALSFRSHSFSNVSKNKTKAEASHLKWLAFSTNSISFLPVFLADSSSTEFDAARRASSADILTPYQLEKALKSATLPTRRGSTLPSPAGMPQEDPQSTAFKATLLWDKIVVHLERSIKCGKHTHGLRIYDNCFQGSKAVHNLTTYLNSILPKTIKKDQVLVLCQKLLDSDVLQDVREQEKSMFRECRLYRFTKNHFWQTSSGSESDSDSEVSHAKCTLSNVYMYTSMVFVLLTFIVVSITLMYCSYQELKVLKKAVKIQQQ